MGEQAIGGAGEGAVASGGAAGRSLIGDGAAAGTGAGAGAAAGAAVVGETWWKGWAKEDGSLDPSRLNHLPPELKEHQALFARFKKVDDFYKSYAHAQSMLGQRPITPLREGATEAERAAFQKQLSAITGAPEKPEGYGIARPEDVPQEMWREQFAAKVAATLHKHGASPELARELMEVNNAESKAAMQEFEEAQARQEDAHWKEQEKLIQQEFGPFKAEKIAAAVQGARWMGLDPESPAFKTNAQLIIAAAKVGEKISDAKFVNGDSSAAANSDPEAELASMVNDPAHKYYDIIRNPGKNARLFQEASLYQLSLGKKIAAKRARA